MTPFDLLTLSLALLAVFIAVFIKRPVVMPYIKFGKPVNAKNATTDIEARMQRTFEIVRKRQQRKRDSKGRFSA